MFIEELGLTVPAAIAATTNTEVKSISALGELLRQPRTTPAAYSNSRLVRLSQPSNVQTGSHIL